MLGAGCWVLDRYFCNLPSDLQPCWPGISVKAAKMPPKTLSLRVLESIRCLWAESVKRGLSHRGNPGSAQGETA